MQVKARSVPGAGNKSPGGLGKLHLVSSLTLGYLHAVHLTYGEASTYCQRRKACLSSETEWREAAYLELRDAPDSSFVVETGCPYPTGNSPVGANCLSE